MNNEVNPFEVQCSTLDAISEGKSDVHIMLVAPMYLKDAEEILNMQAYFMEFTNEFVGLCYPGKYLSKCLDVFSSEVMKEFKEICEKPNYIEIVEKMMKNNSRIIKQHNYINFDCVVVYIKPKTNYDVRYPDIENKNREKITNKITALNEHVYNIFGKKGVSVCTN